MQWRYSSCIDRVFHEQCCKEKPRILVEVPHNEILKYSLDLRSMTQGRGEFTFKFWNYSEVKR
ncbi:MAG: hypothetical protein ACRCTS_02510 [Fusobacteriaceae bacterium]